MYYNGIKQLLYRKRKLQSFEIQCKQFFLLWNKRHPLLRAVLEETPYFKGFFLSLNLIAVENSLGYAQQMLIYID